MSASSRRPTLPGITEVAATLGIAASHVIPYGTDKAKIRLAARADSGRPPGKLVLVTAMTPTGAGEGKTTVTIGLAQGLKKLGENVAIALREPSLGPTFGMKGGATGGGRSVLLPTEDINLHFTGDFHAVTAAHNLLAALLDNHLHHGNALGIDPRRVYWPRVLDVSDRALRHVVTGLGGLAEGVPRETGFDITPASEVMASLCLAEDANDLRARLDRTIVADDQTGEPVTAADLRAVGAMMVLLKDALMPNLVQSGEGVPAFVHGGPFANIAHGCNSVLATKMAMAYADWTITEAGFGADLGLEKFFDIKCVGAGLDTAAVVLVATVRALKRHGGAGRDHLQQPDPAAVARGLVNLEHHIECVRSFGETPLVAINRFDSDTEEELHTVELACERLGVPATRLEVFQSGGEGALALAAAVTAHAERKPSPFRPLYDWADPVRSKLEAIATRMYAAGSVHYTPKALRDLERLERLGMAELPLCVAKTPLSLTDDPNKVGRPAGFEVTVRGLLLSAGAGFIVPLLGDMLRMPGLPKSPQAAHIDLVADEVRGIKA